MTTLNFNLTSNAGCPPLVCGVGNHAFVRLIADSADKSADGSGYLRAEITAVAKLTPTSWRYTVTIDDAEVAPGETVVPDDVEPTLSCISGADAAILAKLPAIETAPGVSWQTFSIFGAAQEIEPAIAPLFRRASAFQLIGAEAAITTGDGPVSIQLQVSGADNDTFTNLGDLWTVTAPYKAARFTPDPVLTVSARCAVRAVVTHGMVYPDTASGLELHLFTSELP